MTNAIIKIITKFSFNAVIHVLATCSNFIAVYPCYIARRIPAQLHSGDFLNLAAYIAPQKEASMVLFPRKV